MGNQLELSKHASKRSQQRAISPLAIDLLLKFGTCQSAGDGASKYFFDKSSRRQLEAYVGPLAKHMSEHLDVYAIVAEDDSVITVAHRTERIRRP